MRSTERIIGALEESKRQIDKRFDRLELKVEQEFKTVRKDVLSLQRVQWKSLGAKSVFVMMLALLVDILFH